MTNRLKFPDILLRSGLILGALILGDFKTAVADEVTVIEIRKNLLLDAADISYKDYYLNGGAEVGLKEGMIVTLTRKLTLHNGPANKPVGDLVVPVGKLKIIFVQKRIAVARFFSTISRQNLPMLDYATVMIGDSVDLSSVAIELPVKETKGALNDDEGSIEESLPQLPESDTVASSMMEI